MRKKILLVCRASLIMFFAGAFLSVLVILLVLAWLIRDRDLGRMSVTFTEIRPMTPQAVPIHPSTTYNVAAAATDADGNLIALSNLAMTPDVSDVGEAVPDDDMADDNVRLSTVDVVGATAQLSFKADGPDGKKFEALADCTIVALEEPAGMALVFTEVV